MAVDIIYLHCHDTSTVSSSKSAQLTRARAGCLPAAGMCRASSSSWSQSHAGEVIQHLPGFPPCALEPPLPNQPRTCGRGRGQEPEPEPPEPPEPWVAATWASSKAEEAFRSS